MNSRWDRRLQVEERASWERKGSFGATSTARSSQGRKGEEGEEEEEDSAGRGGGGEVVIGEVEDLEQAKLEGVRRLLMGVRLDGNPPLPS